MSAQSAREGEWDLNGIVGWRRERLEDAGYPQEEAFLLAGRFDIDLQAACDLLRDGCSLPLAIRILT